MKTIAGHKADKNGSNSHTRYPILTDCLVPCATIHSLLVPLSRGTASVSAGVSRAMDRLHCKWAFKCFAPTVPNTGTLRCTATCQSGKWVNGYRLGIAEQQAERNYFILPVSLPPISLSVFLSGSPSQLNFNFRCCFNTRSELLPHWGISISQHR